MVDWAAALDFKLRPPEFGPLSLRDDGRLIPAMEFCPRTPNDAWQQLCAVWSTLPQHPAILDALDGGNDGAVWLRFSAITWQAYVPTPDAMVSWAAQITEAYRHVAHVVPRDHWWLFSRPDLHVDLGSYVRIGFLPPEPPEAEIGDLESTVHEVCSVLAKDVKSSDLAEHVKRRYQTLDERLAILDKTGFAQLSRTGLRLDAWRSAEEGVGLLLMTRHREALACFSVADELRSTPLTRWGLNQCRAVLGLPPKGPRPLVSRSPTSTSLSDETRGWQDLKGDIERLETERDFKGAIALYYQVRPRADERELVFTRRAQCHLECRETGHSIDFARRAIAINMSALPARTVLTRALIEHKLHADALVEADELVALATYDATAHYLRGKALICLARLEEARDAFDLAIALRPTMIEAMLLRREADRTLGKLGKSVGTQQPIVTVPVSLEPLRDILLGGRIKDAISALQAPGYAAEPDAQLMLARFHAFDRSYGRATELYDRVAESSPARRHTALVGKATVLLEQGQLESALAMFEALLGEDPRDLEACEGKARTLDKLGRVGEAAAEFRRFVSLADAGAKLRARVAQLWLERH